MRLWRHDRMTRERRYNFLSKVLLYLGKKVRIGIIDF